jgi:serine/threonine protein kinase
MSSDPTTTDFIPPELEEIANLLPAYEILSFVAKGGMGAVYMARQKSLDRDVAIKVLPRHFGEDAEFRDSFETEAKSMAKLNHPNLIGIYDFGQIDGLLYIIMEMVQGKSLYHSAYDKTIDSMEAARITVEICNGLAHAHKHGILHRDIKPANILLDPSASAKIGDFGLARAVEDHESDSAFGTPGYTAPEVVHDPAAVDESTDLYSVGVILYQLLTSKLPDSNYVPAAKLVNCDFRFDQVIQKAMNPSPNLRYRHAEDMAKAINQIIDSSPLSLQTQSTTRPEPPATRSLLTSVTNPQKTALNTGSSKPANSPTPTPPTSQIKVGSNAPLIRNLIIIIALLASIAIAWEGLKVVRAKRAAEKDSIAELNQQKDDDADAEKKKKAAAIKLAAENKPKPLPTPPPKVETPRETLSRLQSQLITGSRNEMPKGTITQGGRARFSINDPMTWHQAREFCENHGGHLAILPEKSDIQWLSDKLESDQVIWLGAGSAGNGDWRWIDGTPWKQEIRNTSKASYVCVDNTGVLDPQPAHNKHSFFIEWNMDGSTPASLENQLKRCAASLLENQPLFPAGTISYDNRHYLLVEHNTEWQTARELATLAGGTLATPSNPDENEWMLNFAASSLQNDQACWIGGIRKSNSSWEWANGESWAFAKWGKGLPDDEAPSACAIMPSQIWDDYPVDTSLPCFLIEWSKDNQNHQPDDDKGKAKPNILAPIRKTAAKHIQTIQKKYEAQFTSNIKGYEQELNSYKRRLPKSLQQTYSATIRAMQNRYVNNRIPANLPRHSMPGKLAQILDSRLRIQSQKEAQFLAEIDNLRAKYRNNLSTLAKDFQDKGLTSLQREVQKEINDTSKGGHKFIRHISNSQR